MLIHDIDNMQQTSILRLPRYEMPARTYWVSDRRRIVDKGRHVGREEPVPLGEIIATGFHGKNQKYVFGYQQSTRTAGIEPGYGTIVGFPEQPNGRFYMRRLSYGTTRSQRYDVDAEKVTARLVADIPVKDLDFVLDRQGVPRYATGTDDNNNDLHYAADAQGSNWQKVSRERMGGKFMPFASAPMAMAVPKEGHRFQKDENNVALYQRLGVFWSANSAHRPLNEKRQGADGTRRPCPIPAFSLECRNQRVEAQSWWIASNDALAGSTSRTASPNSGQPYRKPAMTAASRSCTTRSSCDV